eukprot:Partr_v1_DN26234_c0_g2_i2_m48487 putative Required for the maintenance of the structure of the mitochondrial inner membrane. Involved in mitochondrial morphology. Causes growth arrest when highly overexpressed (By similarity)
MSNLIKDQLRIAHSKSKAMITSSRLSLSQALSSRRQLAARRGTDLLNKVNSLTGYAQIEALKSQVHATEHHYAQCRQAVMKAKAAHSKSLNSQNACQKDINELLQRKHTWTPEDVSRFTQLYAQEHALEQTEQSQRALLDTADRNLDHAHSQMLDAIRRRYQEEQIWSDNVRSLSSYGTIGLVLANLLMFVGVHSFIEPRRRQQLLDSIDNLVSIRWSQQSLIPASTAYDIDDIVQRAVDKSAESLDDRISKLLMTAESARTPMVVDLPPPPPLSQPVSPPAVDMTRATALFAGGSVVGLVAGILMCRS